MDEKVLVYQLHHLKDSPYVTIWVYINPTPQVYYQSFPEYVDLLANEAGRIRDYAVQSVAINPFTMVIVGSNEM